MVVDAKVVAAVAAVVSIAALAFVPTLGDIAEAAESVPLRAPLGGDGIERGIARVICARRGSEAAVRVRAVVIDLSESEPKHDVLLAPAHGLPQDTERIKRDCRVYGGQQSPARIAAYWLSEDQEPGTDHDWVVLMTRSPLPDSIGRLRVGQVSESDWAQLVTDETPVDVMLFSAELDQSDCQVLELLPRRGVFSHSCAGWAGLSGAPIVLSVDGSPVVIGIQIASTVRPSGVGGPLFIGVGLPIDDSIANAIRRAAQLARD